MERELFPPFTVEYAGNDTDVHMLDAVQAGTSIAGTARMYNSVLHAYFIGQVPTRRASPLIRTFAQAPTSGTLDLIFVAAAAWEQMALCPDVLRECAKFFLSKMLEAIFAKRTHSDRQMDKALEIIQEQSRQQYDLTKTAIGAIVADKAALYGLVDRLVEINRTPMADMVAPIGSGCKTMTHLAHTPMQQVIDEPVAEVMRSKEDLAVGAQTEMIGTILGVDKSTGACRIKLADSISEVRGKITDPILTVPHNIYTRALDNGSEIFLTVKPLLRDGEISKLYISDAHSKHGHDQK